MLLFGIFAGLLTTVIAAAPKWQDILSNDTDIMIVSDVDDILRYIELWNPKRAVDYAFRKPFKPIPDMKALYSDYDASIPDHVHFAYVTDAPWLIGERYKKGLREHYPLARDGEHYIFRELKHFFTSRSHGIQKFINNYPNRKFILVGDFATPGLTDTYAKLARKNNQVHCMFMQDVRADNPANHFAPATKSLNRTELKDRWTVFANATEFRNVSLKYIHDLASHTKTNESFGCQKDLLRRQDDWNILTNGSHYSNLHSLYVILTRGVMANMQCLMMNTERPHPACRFDRRDGTYYPSLQKFDNQGRLEDFKFLPNTTVNGTKFEYMCHDINGTYLGKDGCRECSLKDGCRT